MERYKELIDDFKRSFLKSIENEDDFLIGKLSNAFEKYILMSLTNLQESDNKFIKKDKGSIETYLDEISQSIIQEDIKGKKKLLLVDETYNKIKQISLESFDIAKKIALGKTPKFDFEPEKRVKEMESLLNTVEEYNKSEAIRFVSEGILDLQFISKPNSKIVSIRLGNILNEIKKL